MKTTLLLLALMAACAAVWAEPLTLYVAPGGSDAADGSVERPLASVARARDEIRRRRPAGGASVVVAAGTYRLDAPLELEPQDSGAEGAPVVYQAAPGAAVSLSGGVVLTGWRVD